MWDGITVISGSFSLSSNRLGAVKGFNRLRAVQAFTMDVSGRTLLGVGLTGCLALLLSLSRPCHAC